MPIKVIYSQNKIKKSFAVLMQSEKVYTHSVKKIK